jgi:hypothetical protein
MSKSGSITTTINGGTELQSSLALVGNTTMPVTLDLNLAGDISLSGDGKNPLALAVAGDGKNPLALSVAGDGKNPLALSVAGDGKNPLAVALTGDKTKPITLDLGLDVHVDKLELQLDPLEITLSPVKVDLGLDNINVCLSLAFTQFPRMQLRMPKNYDFGFSLFGMPVLGFKMFGESSYIADDLPTQVFQSAEGPPQADRAPAFATTPATTPREAPYRVVLSE